ncbi:AAA domain-containing protein [Phellopilus nigrolimitatus]|nr:AAA domain-containing protein [Phellopilus nigrolimitatus]
MDQAGTSQEPTLLAEFQPWNEDGAQIVLVLVGLIASGKSTFAEALEAHVPQFRRCNQDDLGDRSAVERLARKSLRQGLSVCIDRTNFDDQQRAHWINIAREIPRTKLWCIVFNTPLNICIDRLQHRTNHPTIHSSEEGIQILYRFQHLFNAPTANEGFERIISLRLADHPAPTYTKDELQTILLQVATSPPPAPVAQQRRIREYFGASPSHGRGGRAGWRGRGRGYSTHGNEGARQNGRSAYLGSASSLSASSRDQLRSFNAGYHGSQLFQNPGRASWRRGENTFQGNQVVMSPERTSPIHVLSRNPEHKEPSKQSEGGTAEFPITIE